MFNSLRLLETNQKWVRWMMDKEKTAAMIRRRFEESKLREHLSEKQLKKDGKNDNESVFI